MISYNAMQPTHYCCLYTAQWMFIHKQNCIIGRQYRGICMECVDLNLSNYSVDKCNARRLDSPVRLPVPGTIWNWPN